MLARRLTTILPAMRLAEAIDTTRIHSIAGLTGARTALVATRPFRVPHHTISDVGLIGDGGVPLPGKVSRAPQGCCSWTSCRSLNAISSNSEDNRRHIFSLPSHRLSLTSLFKTTRFLNTL
jgi:Magnesium chelatase, subunit ChlI